MGVPIALEGRRLIARDVSPWVGKPFQHALQPWKGGRLSVWFVASRLVAFCRPLQGWCCVVGLVSRGWHPWLMADVPYGTGCLHRAPRIHFCTVHPEPGFVVSIRVVSERPGRALVNSQGRQSLGSNRRFYMTYQPWKGGRSPS